MLSEDEAAGKTRSLIQLHCEPYNENMEVGGLQGPGGTRLAPLVRTTCQHYTNLFDVIASLGTGLYVHHIELTSFPLCRLNRNLPATVPRKEGGGGGGSGEMVLGGNTKKF